MLSLLSKPFFFFLHTEYVKEMYFKCVRRADHFTVVNVVAWPLNENEAGGDLVLVETSLIFLCKLFLISMRTAS